MDSSIKIISRLENALNIKLEQLEKGAEMSGNTYATSSYTKDAVQYEKLTDLHLTKLHFENFAALEPVFETLYDLTLSECSIANAWELHQIKLSYLTLEKCSISIDSKIHHKPDHHLKSLTLSEISFSSLKAFTPVFYSVENVYISHCTLENMSPFLFTDFVDTIHMDSVTLVNEDTFDPNAPKIKTAHRNFQHLYLKNMSIPHPGFFLPISKHLEYVTFTKCTVSNIHELNLFPRLYSLNIDDTDFIASANDIQYQRESKGKFTHLDFKNMKLKDFDFFAPISDGLAVLRLNNCEIESLKSICQFQL